MKKRRINQHRFFSVLFLAGVCTILVLFVMSTISSQYQENNRSGLIEAENRQNISDIKPRCAAPILSFYTIAEINDDSVGSSVGDGDGQVDAGETIELRIRLYNSGDQDANSVYGTIACTDTNVSITTNTQSYITIPMGASGICSSYYLFRVNSSSPANRNITFTIAITATEGSWNDQFNITIVSKPELLYYRYSVTAEQNGDLIADSDGVVDPGEIIVKY